MKAWVSDLSKRERPCATMLMDFTLTFEPDLVHARSHASGVIEISPKLMDLATTESELAGVIGHEVAHQLAHRGEERAHLQVFLLASQCLFWRTTIPGACLLAVGKSDPLLCIHGLILACPVVLAFLLDLHLSRLHEYEADRIGTSLMASAGYDPAAAPSIMQKFYDMRRGEAEKLLKELPSGSVLPMQFAWLRSHPSVR